MKKFIFLIGLVVISFASPIKTEINIFNLVFGDIFQDKTSIKIWNNYKILDKFLCDQKKYKCVNELRKADLIILKKEVKVTIKKPIFVLKYYLLKRYKNQVIGGFYWQKGRPNIIFIKDNLKKFHIILPDKFQIYTESINDL